MSPPDGAAAPRLRVIAGATDADAAQTPDAAPVSPAVRRRQARLGAELDFLEMVPFSDPDAAYAPAAVLERRARALGDEGALRRAQLIQADVLCRKGKHTASGQLIREINEWATEHGHRQLMARSHRLLSVFFDFIGDVPSAWEHAVPAVELLDDTMSERMRADHLFGLGQVLVRTGAWDAARERYRAALQLADGLDDVPLRVKILNNLAWLEDDAGDTHQSMEIAKRMQAFAQQHGVTLDAACLDTIANAQLKLGLYADAEATLRPILDDEHLNSRPIEGLGEALNTAAGAQRLQGHMADAAATVDRCIELCATRGMVAIRVEALEERARLFAAQGLFQRAYEQYIEFHEEDAALRAAQREANARTLQAVFETTEARREGERFRQLSLRDALTGLRNRRHVDTELPLLLARSREDGAPLAIGLVDLDHFKEVNDRFSHAVGDRVLVRISGILAAATAESGWAARMGGEEFLLVFPGLNLGDAFQRCEDVRRSIESVHWDGAMAGEVVTASIGFTMLRSGRTSQAALLGQADRNLYAAKHQGRNRVVSDLA
ncbi:MAG: diguanylate cyclase [Candidatus Dormibacteria bacterium]